LSQSAMLHHAWVRPICLRSCSFVINRGPGNTVVDCVQHHAQVPHPAVSLMQSRALCGPNRNMNPRRNRSACAFCVPFANVASDCGRRDLCVSFCISYPYTYTSNSNCRPRRVYWGRHLRSEWAAVVASRQDLCACECRSQR
jgi:hypothetical protein